READIKMPLVEDIFRATFVRVFETLSQFIAAAQHQRLIRAGLSPVIVARAIFGSMMNACRSDSMIQKLSGTTIADPKYRDVLAEQYLELFLHGCASEERREGRESRP